MKRLSHLAQIAIAVGLLMLGSSFAGDEEKVPVDELPQAVLDAVENAVPGGNIQEAEKETEKGKVVYEVEVLKDGKEYEVEVSESGSVLEVEEEGADENDDDDEDDGD